jgi:hypothetical protein
MWMPELVGYVNKDCGIGGLYSPPRIPSQSARNVRSPNGLRTDLLGLTGCQFGRDSCRMGARSSELSMRSPSLNALSPRTVLGMSEQKINLLGLARTGTEIEAVRTTPEKIYTNNNRTLDLGISTASILTRLTAALLRRMSL